MGDKISSSTLRKKSTLSPPSSRRRNRRPKDSDADSQITPPEKRLKHTHDRSSHLRRSSHRSRSNTIRRRRVSSERDDTDDCTSENEDDGRRRKSKRLRNISNEEIDEYVINKAQKKALKVANKLKTQNVSGYSNDANHFGDVNLNEKFVWRKKIERDVFIHGVTLDAYSVKSEKKRQVDRMAEIEKLKKRREERAIEKAQHEEETALLARERARASELQDWGKKEEKFHFDQCKLRSEIRLREGRRIKPIDVLYKQLKDSDEFSIDIQEPHIVFKGLTVKETEDLSDDIKMHLDLDRASPTHTEYWEALLVVTDWELAGARKKDALDRARLRGEEPSAELLAQERGVHSSIETEIENTIQGKSRLELKEYQLNIESMMRSGAAQVVEFWEAVLKRIHVYKAKARLREILEQPLKNEDQSLSPEPTFNEETRVVKLEEDEDAGSYSPELLHGDAIEEAIDPEEDKSILERKRKAVLEEQQRRMQEAMAAAKPVRTEDNLELKAMKAMGAMEVGEEILGSGAQVIVDSQVYWWHGKYQPRKPKYLNRVHAGYEWNKYNQTHYDHDNPPPKMVQGYKFNIFYTDLVDKMKTPVFTMEKDGDSAETCIIRFHAGPPYEDIAFRIINKEWETSPKMGFKNTFERGILHVYFNFKRLRYRR